MITRPHETLNPVRILREWEGRMDEAKRQELKAAQAAFFHAPIDSLCAHSTRYLAEPLSPHNPKPIALTWLINRELTRRGLAPRWRGLPRHISDEPAPNVPSTALPPGSPQPISVAARRRALLRWIDLEWLCAIMGKRHVPALKRHRHLFEPGGLDSLFGEKAAELLANSTDEPYKVCAGLDLQPLVLIGLCALQPKEAAQRARSASERARLRIRPKLDAHCERSKWPPTATQHAERLRWIEAIELARGSPTDAAALYGWMAGTVVTRQAAANMRRKLAVQLDLRSAAWG